MTMVWKTNKVCDRYMARWGLKFNIISKTLPELFEKWFMWELYSKIELIFKKEVGGVLWYECNCGECGK